MMFRFHEMLLLSARCPKPPGRQISDMNEDLENPSKDQSYYLTHWLDISQNSEKKARIHQFGKKLSRGILLVLLYSRRRIWENDTLINDIEEFEKR